MTTVAILVALALPAYAGELIARDVSRLTLRPQVQVSGGPVRLVDVVNFAHADPRLQAEIGQRPVIDEAAPADVTVVTHDQVVQRLEALGVNLSRVLVDGALVCRVSVAAAAASELETTATDSSDAEVGALLRSQSVPVGQTLADVLQAYAARELDTLGGTAEVEFERAGQEFLTLTTPPWKFRIRSNRGPKLGLREFSITLRRDGRTQRTVRIGARLRLVKNVLVARRALGIGNYVRAEDVQLQKRVFDSERELGLDHSGQIVGQQVKRFIPVGGMICHSDIKAVDLVKRSRPVTVIGADGGIHVQISGVALDNGGYGDAVRIRIGESRRDRREIRGVVTSLGTVRIQEGLP